MIYISPKFSAKNIDWFDFAKQRKQRTRPILLSPFRTKERRRDVLHALFLEKLGKNGEKKYRAMFVY